MTRLTECDVFDMRRIVIEILRGQIGQVAFHPALEYSYKEWNRVLEPFGFVVREVRSVKGHDFGPDDDGWFRLYRYEDDES